ncbi:MAG: DUF2314 domain-containing protein, partial [Myxococcales bacterium]|nr:DUF2314 domain-containing protein [Myxococcales bacterium]
DRIAATARARGLTIADPDGDPSPGTVAFAIGAPAALGYQADTLPYFGRGFDDAETAAIGACETAVALSVVARAEDVAELHRTAAALARDGAAGARGWIVDQYSAEIFTRAAFDKARPADLGLDVTRLLVIHAVPADELIFLETRGMGRFGLPDLYLPGVPTSYAEDLMMVLNVTAQTLVDQHQVTTDGVLAVDARKVAASLGGDVATLPPDLGKVTWTATWSTGDDDEDPSAGLIELTPPGGNTPAHLREVVVGFFGSDPDEIHQVADDDPEMLAARDRARAALAALAPHFAQGVPAMERLLVKAPFKTDGGGAEWMWVEVTAWTGGTMAGILINEPAQVSGLHNGDRVEVQVAELFDYLHQRADGTTAGGETNQILERRGR